VNATGRRHVVATFTADGSSAVVSAARDRLAQLFENLLSNAVSFAPDGTTIDVKVTGAEGTCVISVADRGPGIPKAHLQRVFDRFFSYRPGEGRRDHVGLGLAIAKQIVESYGGTIAASNRSEGGARFEVRLPLAAVQKSEVISV
jgi:two-component system, OmpR family, sensor histidine kinase ChvG